mmetsp:Transcript_20053/g.55464  ORF Transcript_20053/g.55464 Transcript_20053/m.55464 type:complete len:209 (+) Transcript_20053:415-1041(+)
MPRLHDGWQLTTWTCSAVQRQPPHVCRAISCALIQTLASLWWTLCSPSGSCLHKSTSSRRSMCPDSSPFQSSRRWRGVCAWTFKAAAMGGCQARPRYSPRSGCTRLARRRLEDIRSRTARLGGAPAVIAEITSTTWSPRVESGRRWKKHSQTGTCAQFRPWPNSRRLRNSRTLRLTSGTTPATAAESACCRTQRKRRYASCTRCADER